MTGRDDSVLRLVQLALPQTQTVGSNIIDDGIAHIWLQSRLRDCISSLLAPSGRSCSDVLRSGQGGRVGYSRAQGRCR